MRCGKCRGLGQCYHIDENCKNGCEIGFDGLKCTEGKHIHWVEYLVSGLRQLFGNFAETYFKFPTGFSAETSSLIRFPQC